jgi:hypothetical protein
LRYRLGCLRQVFHDHLAELAIIRRLFHATERRSLSRNSETITGLQGCQPGG